MNFLSNVIIVCLSILLTACPSADPPPPIVPLSVPKTQKISFKSEICRLEMPWMKYDKEGKLRLSYASDVYEYDDAGFVRNKTTYDGNEVRYEYDANGLLTKETLIYNPKNYSLTLWKSNTRYYRNGILYDIEDITQGGQTLRRYEISSNGRIKKQYYANWDQEEGKYYINQDSFDEYVYDHKGNLTLSRSMGNLLNPNIPSQEFIWEYDDRPNPTTYLPKGHPANPLESPVNNITMFRNIIYDLDEYKKEQETATFYSYEYNANGYPDKSWFQYQNIIKDGKPASDGNPTEKTLSTIYLYNGCSPGNPISL